MVLGWGKKMQKTQKDDEDMSMEEILASIRKYVTDDYQPSKQETVPPDVSQSQKSNPTVVQAEEPSEISAPRPDLDEADVLDLVDVVEPSVYSDDEANHLDVLNQAENPAHNKIFVPSPSSSLQPDNQEKTKEEYLSQSVSAPVEQPESANFNGVVSEAQSTASVSGRIIDSLNPESPSSGDAPLSTDHLRTPLNDFSSTPTFKGNPMAQIQSTPQASFHDEGLASKETLSSSSHALNKLVQAVKPQVQSAAETAKTNSSTAQTLDTLIGDLARPLVKQWIDQNLSGMVEAMVSKEIEKITKNLIS